MGNAGSCRATHAAKSHKVTVLCVDTLACWSSTPPLRTTSDANATIYVSKKDPYTFYKNNLMTHIKDKDIRKEISAMKEAPAAAAERPRPTIDLP